MMLDLIRRKIIEQKFRFDSGFAFLSLVNFALLVKLNSDGLVKLFPQFLKEAITQNPYSSWLITGLFVAMAFGSVWLFGTFMVVVAGYEREMASIKNKYNPEITEILERVKNIEAEIKQG